MILKNPRTITLYEDFNRSNGKELYFILDLQWESAGKYAVFTAKYIKLGKGI